MAPNHPSKVKNHREADDGDNASGDEGVALALSGKFHVEIARIAANYVFTDFVQSLVKRSSLIIALYWKRPDTTCESHSHNALMDAFGNGDGEAAEKIMRSHIVDLHSGLDLTAKNDEPVSLAEALKA